MHLIRIGYNHDTGRKLGNLIVVLSSCKNLRFFDIYIVIIVSSVSAQKLKCPSLAQLGSEPS